MEKNGGGVESSNWQPSWFLCDETKHVFWKRYKLRYRLFGLLTKFRYRFNVPLVRDDRFLDRTIS